MGLCVLNAWNIKCQSKATKLSFHCRLAITFLILSATWTRFCLKSLSLYSSMISLHLTKVFLTLGRAASGGHDVNLRTKAMIGLLRDSASFRSLTQLSLWIYLGVTQHITNDECFILRCMLLFMFSLVSCDVCRLRDERVLRLLCPLIWAPESDQQEIPLASSNFWISATYRKNYTCDIE